MINKYKELIYKWSNLLGIEIDNNLIDFVIYNNKENSNLEIYVISILLKLKYNDLEEKYINEFSEMLFNITYKKNYDDLIKINKISVEDINLDNITLDEVL